MTKYEFPQGPGEQRPEGVLAGRDWTSTHDLVNLYLGIAVLADSDLDPEEQRTFMRKFSHWLPDVSVREFDKVWGEVVELHQSLNSGEARYAAYLQSTVNVVRFFGGDRDKLRAIIRDLVDIAGADEKLHENEVTMIKAAAVTFGLSADLRVNVKTGRIELVLKDAN